MSNKFQPYKVQDNVLCHINPTLIRPKANFACWNLDNCLREVSDISNKVLVWSAMFKSNVKPVAEHLFSGCRPPYDVLSYD